MRALAVAFAVAAGFTPAAATGPAWSVVASPNAVGKNFNFFYDVSCISSSFCVAVGVSIRDQPLIESWNGSRWSLVASPDRGGGTTSALTAVSCVSASFCVAAGGTYSTAAASWQNRLS